MMQKRIEISLLFILLVCSTLTAQMTQSLIVENKPDLSIQIIPTDEAHRSELPASLVEQLAKLPKGSFVLKNNTNKSITALVVLWTYTDANGTVRKHRFSTDAYYLPIDWTVVKPLSLLLVTPAGYASEEQFQALASAGIFDPVPGMERNNAVLPVRVSLDCIIFEDGAVLGPDALKYYLTLLTRRSVLEELSTEFKDAKSAGEDFKTHFERMRSEAAHVKNKRDSLRRDYVGMLARNPNPEALFRKLETMKPLPEFHHVGGDNQ